MLYNQIKEIPVDIIKEKLDLFFQEDQINKDITTNTFVDKNKNITAKFVSEYSGVFCGMNIIENGFSDKVTVQKLIQDGFKIKPETVIANITGPADEILKKERVILNLLQRLSGIATITYTLAKKLKKYNIQLLDTRKTTPGLREFEKFAVSVGGGTNHRFSLKDAVMIKDNHLIGNPNLKDAVDNAAKKNPGKDIQVEVDTKTQLEEALDTKATSLLLDNFSPETLSETIKHIRAHKNGKNIYIELSGGINPENINEYCIKGVNGISMGALTHNIKSKDISLDLK